MKRFKFDLDPLLEKHLWDVDMFRAEKATATRAVEEKQTELDAIEAQIAHCRTTLVDQASENAEISLGQRQVIETYIRHQQTLAQETQKALDKAKAIEQQIADQLLAASKQVKTLEKLKERAKQQHDYHQLRAELTEADDNWLSRQNHL